MKLSVSLPEDEVQFLDDYAETEGFDSRSAVVLKAVRLLRAVNLGDAYEDAWNDWEQSGEQGVWASTVGDGLRASR